MAPNRARGIAVVALLVLLSSLAASLLLVWHSRDPRRCGRSAALAAWENGAAFHYAYGDRITFTTSIPLLSSDSGCVLTETEDAFLEGSDEVIKDLKRRQPAPATTGSLHICVDALEAALDPDSATDDVTIRGVRLWSRPTPVPLYTRRRTIVTHTIPILTIEWPDAPTMRMALDNDRFVAAPGPDGSVLLGQLRNGHVVSALTLKPGLVVDHVLFEPDCVRCGPEEH